LSHAKVLKRIFWNVQRKRWLSNCLVHVFFSRIIDLFFLPIFFFLFQVLDHLVIQKLNAEGRLEKKESKKGGSIFDKVGFGFDYLVSLF